MQFRTVSEATKAIKDAISDDVSLTEERAKEVWVNLGNVNLQHHGDLLYEFFLARPVPIPGYQAQTILEYLQKSRTGFDKVLDYVTPEILIRGWQDYEIPPASLTPIILKNPNLISHVHQHPELYTDALSDLLLGHIILEGRSGYGSHSRQLCRKIPSFWEKNREKLIPLLVGKHGQEDLNGTFRECSDIMTPEEKFGILTDALSKITSANNHPMLRSLYKTAGEYLTIEERDKFRALLKTKIEELLAAEKERDPMEAFLEGEMQWEAMVFARLYPEEFRKMQMERQSSDDGPFPGMMGYRGLFFRRLGYG